MQDRLERWRHLEVSLTALVDQVATQIDQTDLRYLREFIEHREFGETLDLLVALPNIQFDVAQAAEIQRLADLMGMTVAVRAMDIPP